METHSLEDRMPDSQQTTGNCLCGGVKIAISIDHNEVGACHCKMCRKWSSGPYMAIEPEKATIVEGQEHIATYRSSEWAERGFCKTCGSNLFYRLVEADKYYVSAGLFGMEDRMALSMQVFIDEKPSYYDFANQTKTMTGPEIFAMFAPPEASN